MTTEIFFSKNLDSNCHLSHTIKLFKKKSFQPTNITIFEKKLHSNDEFNNVSNFIAIMEVIIDFY